jgi:hypothetical protein
LHRVFKQHTTPAAVRQQMGRVITVATPFYGSATHMQRYYKGEDPLNLLYGATTLAKITGSFPGPYIFLFLDKKTYDRNAAKLEVGRYPVRDADNEHMTADPFDLRHFNRYPPWVNRDYLIKAKRLYKTIAKELPDAVVDRVFHIRAAKRKTVVEHRWKAVSGGHFKPNKDPSPVTGPRGAGDGTIPAWAARLVQVPDNQVFDLNKAKSHSDLLEHQETLAVVHRLIETDRMPGPIVTALRSLAGPKASKKAARDFITGVAAKKRIPLRLPCNCLKLPIWNPPTANGCG